MKISPAGGGLGPIVTGAQEAPRPDIRRLRMSTNASPSLQEPEEVAESVTPDTKEANAVTEETVPLSPQLAAIARQRRALQQERQALDREKAEIATRHTSAISKERIKSDPLSVLQEAGVTYDELRDHILANKGQVAPELLELRAEVKALKEGVDERFTSQATQAEEQVLAEMQKEALSLASDGEDFELIRQQRKIPKVMELIKRTYKEHGDVLDVREAMQLIEDELLKDSLQLANIKKVQSHFAPAPAPQQTQPQRTMRTLTNRDTARAVMSAKARAIAAFNGQLKK